MLKTFAFAAALVAITSGSALAQSYNPEFGTANVSATEQSQILPQDQGLNARAQAVESRHHANASTFTNDEKALFGRIRPY